MNNKDTWYGWLGVLLVGLILLIGGCTPGTGQTGPATTPGPGWSIGSPMPTARGAIAGAAISDTIYVVGGYVGKGTPVNTVEAYDTTTDRWRTVAPLPQPLHHAAAVAAEGKLYVVGGWTGPVDKPPSSATYVYDPATNRWSRKADMPFGRAAHGLEYSDSTIFVLGGIGEEFAEAILSYIPEADLWSVNVLLSVPRQGLAVANYIGYIYTFGGRVGNQSSDAVEAFWPAAEWLTRLPPLPLARSFLAAATVGDFIYTFGGEDIETNQVFGNAEALDAIYGTWQQIPPLPTPRHSLIAVAVNNRIYTIGGATRAGSLARDHWSHAVEIYTPPQP